MSTPEPASLIEQEKAAMEQADAANAKPADSAAETTEGAATCSDSEGGEAD